MFTNFLKVSLIIISIQNYTKATITTLNIKSNYLAAHQKPNTKEIPYNHLEELEQELTTSVRRKKNRKKRYIKVTSSNIKEQ